MHLLQLPVRLDLGNGNVVEAGEYLTTDAVGAQLLLIANGGTMTPLTETRRLCASDEHGNMVVEQNGLRGYGRRILFLRPGGFGDLVLLTPVLREVKRRWPTCHIAVSTMASYGAVLAGLPYVDEIVPFPLPKATADTFDAWVLYENAIETNPRARELHMTDLFGEIAGVDMTDADKLPDYRVKATEAIWANEAYPRINGGRRVCIQVGASGRCRRYPTIMLGEVVRDLLRNHWEVFLLGAPGEIDMKGRSVDGLRNLCDAGLTFRQSCALVAQADAFLGSDSALLHVAGALGVPAVGLYGAFPWKLRTAYCPTTFALQGEGACAPCFHHVSATGRDPFPAHCPSAERGVCQVLETIKPARIVAKIEQVARKFEERAEVVEFTK